LQRRDDNDASRRGTGSNIGEHRRSGPRPRLFYPKIVESIGSKQFIVNSPMQYPSDRFNRSKHEKSRIYHSHALTRGLVPTPPPISNDARPKQRPNKCTATITHQLYPKPGGGKILSPRTISAQQSLFLGPSPPNGIAPSDHPAVAEVLFLNPPHEYAGVHSVPDDVKTQRTGEQVAYDTFKTSLSCLSIMVTSNAGQSLNSPDRSTAPWRGSSELRPWSGSVSSV